jgi:hypothetical protein
VPRGDYSHTRPSPPKAGDPLLEFPSEAKGQVVTPRIAIVKTTNDRVFNGALQQFLPEAQTGSVRPVAGLEVNAPGVTGTERFAAAVPVKAGVQPISVGSVLPDSRNPRRPHPARSSLVLFGAAVPVAFVLVLLALHARNERIVTDSVTMASPAPAPNELRSSPLAILPPPELVPERHPFMGALEPIGATVSIPDATPTRSTVAVPVPAPTSQRVETGTSVSSFRGSLTVTSSPEGAQVHLNNVWVGTTPLLALDVPVGSRVIRVELEGHERWSSVVRIVANEPTTVAAELQPSRIP